MLGIMLHFYEPIISRPNALNSENPEESFDFKLQEEVLKPLAQNSDELIKYTKGEAIALKSAPIFEWGFKNECQKAVVSDFYFNEEKKTVSLVLKQPKVQPEKVADLFYPLIRGSEFGPIISLYLDDNYAQFPIDLEWVFNGGHLNFIFTKFGQVTGGVGCKLSNPEWEAFYDLLTQIKEEFGDNFINDTCLRFLFPFRNKIKGEHRDPNGKPLTKLQNLEASYADGIAQKYAKICKVLLSEATMNSCYEFKKRVGELEYKPDEENYSIIDNFFVHIQKLAEIRSTEDPISNCINHYILHSEFGLDLWLSIMRLGMLDVVGDIMRDTVGKIGWFFEELAFYAVANSSMTDSGKKYPYFRSLGNIQYFDLSQDVSTEKNRFWMDENHQILWNLDETLIASDAPISALEICNATPDEEVLLYPIEEIRKTTNLLFEEAFALKEYHIPPKAYVQISFGPFIGCYLTEKHNDVLIKWVTADGLFFQMSMWPKSNGFQFFFFGENELWEHSRSSDPLNPKKGRDKLTAIKQKLLLLGATIIRDFWVVDRREDVFYVRERSKKINNRTSVNGKNPAKYLQSVVYIPRRKYAKRINLSNYESSLSLSERAKHIVKQHFRKAKPSAAQIQLAKILQVQIPVGHTLVKTHYRGGEEKQLIYRSISALALAANSFSEEIVKSNELPTWFDFENEVGRIQKLMGYEILFKAPNYNGDGGIDLRVRKKTSKKVEEVIIQCKCWKNTVGPDVVRELMGTLVAHGTDEVELRGAIYTTSKFSQEATALALKHNIQLVDGDTWAKLSNQLTH